MYNTYKTHLAYILPVTTMIGICSGVYLSMKHKLYTNGNVFIFTILGNTYIGIVCGYLYPITAPLMVGYAVHVNSNLQSPSNYIPFFNK